MEALWIIFQDFALFRVPEFVYQMHREFVSPFTIIIEHLYSFSHLKISSTKEPKASEIIDKVSNINFEDPDIA